MNNEPLDAAFMAAGGHKKVNGEYVPYFSISPTGKTIIEETLDMVVRTNVKRVVIWASDQDRMTELLSKRTREDNNYKDIHILRSQSNIAESFLYALTEYTKINDELKPFSGDWKNPLDFKRYVQENPNSLEQKVIVVPYDIPFEDYEKINDRISEHLKKHYRWGVEFTAVFTKKKTMLHSLNEIKNSNTHFNVDNLHEDSTLFNYFLLSNKKVRLSNMYILSPFRVRREAFDFVDDLYALRYVSDPKNWPEIGKVVVKHLVNWELSRYIPGILKQVSKSVLSCDKVRTKTKNEFIRRILDFITNRGGSAEILSYYTGKILGIKCRLDFRGSAGAMLDIDDEKTAYIAKEFYTDLKYGLMKHSIKYRLMKHSIKYGLMKHSGQKEKIS